VIVVAPSIAAAVGWAVLDRGTGDAQAIEAAPKPAARPAPSAKPQTTVATTKGRPSDKARLELLGVITGNTSPKSVASSGTGYVTAQNMMYRHSATVYDARTLKLVKTTRGAPVEAAFSTEGRYAYASNYSMSGQGFGPEGSDSCTPSSGCHRSFVDRIDMENLKIDQAYKVGAVPKVVAVTPDHRYVLVRPTRRVWVACYTRSIRVYNDW